MLWIIPPCRVSKSPDKLPHDSESLPLEQSSIIGCLREDLFVQCPLSWLLYQRLPIKPEMGIRNPHRLKLVCLLSALVISKVSMLNHIYPHKPLREMKLITCNHQADSPFTCGLMYVSSSDLQRNEYGHPWHWHWMSLLRPGVVKQYKPL